MSSVPENANADCPGGPAAEGAGTASACEGCPNQAACASGVKTVDPAVARAAARLAGVRNIVLVLSGKGGVGKSTFSSQLAFTLAEQGCAVGLLDVDICGPSIPRMLGAQGAKVHQAASGWSPVWLTENLGVMSIGFMLPAEDDAVIWRGPKKNGLIQQFLGDVEWGELDYLVVDTPPGTSDEHISMVQLLRGEGAKPANLAGAVVVTTPQEVAMADVRKELNFCVKTNLPVLGVVENMSGFACPCCGTSSDIFKASGEGPRGMAARFGVPFLGALPIDPQLLACCEKGEAYVVKHAGSPGAAAFLGVVAALRGGIEGGSAGGAGGAGGAGAGAGAGEGGGGGSSS